MDGSSTLDNSTSGKGLYLDVLLNGCMDLIKFYKDRVDDKLPNHIHRLFPSQCCTFFTWNSLINHPERARMLNAEVRTRFQRSEERRVGKEWVRTCRVRRRRYHTKKMTNKK